MQTPAPEPVAGRWWHGLNRYHWFVFIVASLGWLFDCLDQQLFTLSRMPAMKALLPEGYDPILWGGYATSVFLAGWATGGLIFGALGDRIGRAKTMMLTILIYSLCTGLSALSTSFWDFAFYRFITGLGVGGEFAVGVALLAEVMPARSRSGALGALQALSAMGNISAALIGMGMANLEKSGTISLGNSWRWMFVIGAIPALLALVIRARMKEPERWQKMKDSGALDRHSVFTYGELFRDPRWRRNAIIGMLLVCSGVIGLWGIGFFTPELIRTVLSKTYAAQGMTKEQIGPLVDKWASWGLLTLQVGAFFGMLSASWVAARLGRRKAFAIAFSTALIATACAFQFYTNASQTFWLIPIMGFFQLAVFAVYAIYLPELFPTHLRSTGTSFCYNVGRFLAAAGVPLIGMLKTEVFAHHPEPMRPAALVMCCVFLLGLIVLPFAPETKDKPLPEDERSFAH
ncbi:MAG: putative niacin/nicotinamide transporter NaiP [Verrucomicrobiota bacterium]|jgi:MFS family permease